MKRNIILLAAISVFLAYMMSLVHFDMNNINALTNPCALDNKDAGTSVRWVLWLSDDFEQYDQQYFHIELNELLKANNLISSKYVYDYDDMLDIPRVRCVFSSNTEGLDKIVMLEEGYADLGASVVYSSNAADKSNKILLHFGGRTLVNEGMVVEVVPLVADDTNRGMYNIFSVNGSSPHDSDITMFKQEFENRYPDMAYTLSKAEAELSRYDNNLVVTFVDVLHRDWKVIIICTAVMILYLGSTIIGMRRVIALMKLEGNSYRSIYRKIYVYPLLYCSLFFCSLTVVFFCIRYSNVFTIKHLALYFLVEYAALMACYLLGGQLLKALIELIPIVSSEKGKNDLAGVYYLAFVLKIICAVIIIPEIAEGIPSIVKYHLLISRYEIVCDKLASYYVFGDERQSTYFGDIGAENYISLRDHINLEHSITHLGASYLYDYSGDLMQIYLGWPMDAEMIGLRDNEIDYDRNIVIYLPYEYSKDKDKLREYAEQLVFDYDIAVVIKEGCLPESIPSISPVDLLYEDYLNSSFPIVIVPEEEGLKGQIESTTMHFEGTLTEVQEYVDKVFHKFGYESAFTMRSCLREYQHLYAYEKSSLQAVFVKLLIFMGIYCLSNRFLVDADILCNRRRYLISMTEGVLANGLTRYLIRIASPLIIGTAITCLGYYDNKTMLYALGIMLMLEMLFGFVYAMKTGGKEGYNGY